MKDKIYRLIGLTGPTGAGKSSVSKVFSESGFAVVNADEVAHNALLDTECIRRLVSAFGKEILCDDNSINRKALAKAAFATKENTRTLNSITHPVIIRLSEDKFTNLADAGYKNIIFDAPTLFEAGMDKDCDLIISVICPLDERIKRIIKRDNITRDEALARINAQKDNTFYTERSDFVIENNGDIETLTKRTEEIIKEII